MHQLEKGVNTGYNSTPVFEMDAEVHNTHGQTAISVFCHFLLNTDVF
jgi:hypothetical protein